jgi:hypothetical protein
VLENLLQCFTIAQGVYQLFSHLNGLPHLLKNLESPFLLVTKFPHIEDDFISVEGIIVLFCYDYYVQARYAFG